MAEAQRVVSPTDEELMGEGSAAAFAELVVRHQRRIRLLCWRVSGSLAESEDLAQETFIRAYHHRDSFQPGKPFVAWLQRICVNVCLTHNERLRHRPPVDALAHEDDCPVLAADDPEARVADADAADRVQRVVERLAEPFRTTLVLRVFGGLSYQEIAGELGCSLGTVMSRINRARMQLRNHLKDLTC